MPDLEGSERPDNGLQRFREDVAAREPRKLKARQEKERTFWFGLGMFGMVGWAVAVPTLMGVALGWWIDRDWPSPFSWTLALLLAGVALGCFNAWYWVSKEQRAIAHEEKMDEH